MYEGRGDTNGAGIGVECHRIALKEWPEKSDRAIAEMCGVSQQFISGFRPQVTTVVTSTRTGRDGKQYPAHRDKPDPAPAPEQGPVADPAPEAEPEPEQEPVIPRKAGPQPGQGGAVGDREIGLGNAPSV